MAKAMWDDPDKLEQLVQDYFNFCDGTRTERVLKSGDIRVRKERPSMAGLADWLNVSRDTLYSYMSVENHASLSAEKTQRIADMLAGARRRIERELITAALNGDCDPRIAALLLSSYGYGKEQTDATVTVRVEGAGGPDVEGWSK